MLLLMQHLIFTFFLRPAFLFFNDQIQTLLRLQKKKCLNEGIKEKKQTLLQ